MQWSYGGALDVRSIQLKPAPVGWRDAKVRGVSRLSCASGPTGKGIDTTDAPVELVASVFVYFGGLISTVVNLLLLEIAFISCFLMRLRLFTVAA